MFDLAVSFAQNEFRTLLHVLCSILASGTFYVLFCIYIGDPMQPKLNQRTVRKLINLHGRKNTEKYLQRYGKTISNFVR